ncbi:hypothetical protein C8R44DRAFT_728599 [Mycena epipterygia]|nr:hypothetical protein C8R44DRAFT_728599 [Mycena epipterygia]
MPSFSGSAFHEWMQTAAANSRSTSTAPEPLACKRPRGNSDGQSPSHSDNERDDPPLALSTSGSATRNAAIAVKNYAKKQKLRGDQLTQLDTFLNDLPTVREGKLFTLLLGLHNDVGTIVVAAPPYTVSPELKTNIQTYAHTVLLSPKLAQYRGDLAVQHVWNILKIHRYDMPPGIENNAADMHKVTKVIQDAFTQCRSTLKKKLQLFASVRVSRNDEAGNKITVDLDPPQHQNLFALAQALVDGTKCRITNALCGRIALMNSDGGFWIDLDVALATMRDVAEGDEEKRDNMFEDLIVADKELHGAVEIIYQANNDVQQEVDDLIAAASADIASTTRASSSAPPDDSEATNEGQGESG